jgi:enoyl-CoA hydratase
MTEVVSFAQHDGVATLTMDDGKANALSLAMSQALEAGLDRAAKEARVVVIRGRPGVLCGGFDLKVIRGDDDAQRKAMRDAGMRLFARLYLLPQPLIFACTGHSVAAGGVLLLTGDVRIGLRGGFRIGLNEVGIGLTLPQTAIELARDRLSAAALTEAVALGRLYNPDGAVGAGYLDAAVDAGAFDATIAQQAQELLKLDPATFAATKQRLRQPTLDRIAAATS